MTAAMRGAGSAPGVHDGFVSDSEALVSASHRRLDAAVFACLALELQHKQGVEETVEAVMEFALQALDCTHSGIVLRLKSGPSTLASNEVVEQLYQFQFERGDGPLIAAYRDDTVVRVCDAASETRWPEWAARATELRLRSVLHLPLRVGGRPVGVMSVLHEHPNAFTEDDEAIAHILAQHASLAVATALRVRDLSSALDARKVVGQAMGILMERFDLDSDRAFAVLRRYSQNDNMKLRDVAERLIETRRLPAPAGQAIEHSRPRANAYPYRSDEAPPVARSMMPTATSRSPMFSVWERRTR
jgi:GAF domain-containing protein